MRRICKRHPELYTLFYPRIVKRVVTLDGISSAAFILEGHLDEGVLELLGTIDDRILGHTLTKLQGNVGGISCKRSLPQSTRLYRQMNAGHGH